MNLESADDADEQRLFQINSERLDWIQFHLLGD
jgi:hypothetical protein